MPKGISLPIELIVIIAVAVLVLVVLAAFLVRSTGSQISLVEHQRALAEGCNQLTFAYSCNVIQKFSEVKIYMYEGGCDGAGKGTLAAACCALNYEWQDTGSTDHCGYVACRCLPPPPSS